MEFDWSKRTIGEWRSLLSKINKANWMQTWPYAQAAFKRDHTPTRLATITQKGVNVAIVAIQEIKLGPVQIVNINRGPLWLLPNPTEENFLEFAELVRKTYPKRLFQRMRWMANWDIQEETKTKLATIGFKQRPEYFLTVWLDLKKSVEQLRSELKQKWRNCLNKSEKSLLHTVKDMSFAKIDLFLNFYSQYKNQKKFHGPTQEFLKEEIINAFQAGDGFLLWAFYEDKPVAGIAILRHGNTASYRVGWNTEIGRKTNAHYTLIWQAILILKEENVEYFDLGGMKPDEAEGISHFKEGLGGQSQLYKIFGN